MSFFYKLSAMGCSLLTIPLTLHYLELKSYGIWLTLTSIVGWFGFFDGGLGNGLKNRLSEALSKNDLQKARSYITVAYVGIAGVVTCIILAFFTINLFLDWGRILKSPLTMSTEINTVIYVVFILFGIRLIVDLISVILSAQQLVSTVSLITLIINVVILAGTYVITQVVHSQKLLYLGTFISVVPVVILIIASLFFFTGTYRHLRPEIVHFDVTVLKEIVSLGMTFFVIQIAGLVIFSSDNLIITQLFGSGEVTNYNICYRYFGILTTGWIIVITPYWIAFNEAFVKKEFEWIRKTIIFLMKAWALLSVGAIAFLIMSPTIYRLWIGGGIGIPFKLSFFMTIFIILSTNINICYHFLNGAGKVRIQFYIAIFGGLINIPLTILCAKTFHMGISGVILGTSLSLFIGGVVMWIQTYKVMHRRDTGIWSK